MPPIICLNMIVKNEAGVIRRCLDSVRPYIQRWEIVDTGSTDGTQELVRQHLADLPGELHERPWRDFGHNRSEALALARQGADYILLIDADEELAPSLGFAMPALTADAYLLQYRLGTAPTTWYRATLVNAARPWRYEGVLHEYLTCDIPHDLSRIEGLTVRSHADGARNVDPVRKYAHDVEVLERAARLDPDNPRNIFYLAQSYRDLGNLEKAVAEYERRIALGGWYEEVWYAMFQIGVLEQQLGRAFPAVLSAHLRAYQFHPARAEPLCTLAMHYRTTGEWALAELFAREAAAKPASTDILFVDSSVYEWRALDELAIATYYVGKFRESIDLNLRLLAEGRLPESERHRVEGNLGFAASKLGGGRP